jgi:hypothetical protein
MSIHGRLEALRYKHNNLHSKIEALEAEKAPDKYIKPLKKEKLLLKDQIEKIKKELII